MTGNASTDMSGNASTEMTGDASTTMTGNASMEHDTMAADSCYHTIVDLSMGATSTCDAARLAFLEHMATIAAAKYIVDHTATELKDCPEGYKVVDTLLDCEKAHQYIGAAVELGAFAMGEYNHAPKGCFAGTDPAIAVDQPGHWLGFWNELADGGADTTLFNQYRHVC